MKCPKCGADNPESAEFCSLCMEKLQRETPASPGRGPAAAPGDLYVAPGEWRGDADALRPTVSKVVETKVKRFRERLVIYGVIVAAIVIWLVLSFTVWGNPSPSKRSMQLFDAVNTRDTEAFMELFEEEDRIAAEDIYGDITSYLGASGEYQDIRLDVEVADAYSAASYVEGGNITRSGGSSIGISTADNLVIMLENHGGKWYVVPLGTNLVP